MDKLLKINTTRVLLAIIILYSFYLSNTLLKSYKGIDLTEPKFQTYHSDEIAFLKTYYLIRSGHNYYDSFKMGMEGGFANIKLAPDVFTWRLPTAFYIWSLTTTNGYQILAQYWVLAILFLVSVFLIIKKIAGKNVGLLSTLLIVPYFAGNLSYKTAFLFTEWWALFFLTFGITLFLYRKFKAAWILLLLSVVTRELVIVPLAVFLLLSILSKKNRIFFASIIIVSLIFFYFHSHVVLSMFPNQSLSSTPFFSHLHMPDKQSSLTMISFSMQNYPLAKYRINLVIIALAAISLLVNAKRRNNFESLYLFAVPWSFLVIFPFITTSQYNDYWGILFMPLLISTIPLMLPKSKT